MTADILETLFDRLEKNGSELIRLREDNRRLYEENCYLQGQLNAKTKMLQREILKQYPPELQEQYKTLIED